MPGDLDEEVASWLSGPMSSGSCGAPGAEDKCCPGCGYEGEMQVQASLKRQRCPACGSLLPAVDPFIGCPNCDFAIFVAETELGQTVVCPNCKSFLGCLKPKPRLKRRRLLRR